MPTEQTRVKAESRWPRNETLVCIRDDAELLELVRIVPELEDYAITAAPTTSDVTGRHVIGTLPHDLDWLATSVTRLCYTTATRRAEEWTVDDYLRQPAMRTSLIQQAANKLSVTIQQLGPGEITFISDRPGEIRLWKSHGVIDSNREIVIITTDPEIPREWSRQRVFDRRTSAMVIENGIPPERWQKDVPRGATAIYTHLPFGTEATLIEDRNVAGRIGAELLHRAATLTTWPCDESETRFGQPVTCRYTLLEHED